MTRQLGVLLASAVLGCGSAASRSSSAPTGRPVARDTTVYDTLALTQQPERVSFPPLDYPWQRLQQGTGGTVRLSFILDASGRVEPNSVTVLCATDSAFIRPALDGLRGATFRPGLLHGQPVRVKLSVPLRFVMAGNPLPPAPC
jgi:TonB family protein